LPAEVGGAAGQDGRVDVGVVTDALARDLPHALLALDFDGTLAPVQADPDRSRPAPGALEAIGALAARGARIAVVTGRDALTVLRLGRFDTVPGLLIEGIYGAETWAGGELASPPTPAAIEAARAQLPDVLDAVPADPAVWIEDKRLSLVVHARRAADPDAALDRVREPVAALAATVGLQTHDGRQVIELRLPGFDKGRALRHAAERTGAHIVLYVGDDLGDVPAFKEIHALRAEGCAAFSVGVLSGEVPELAELTDVQVEGPAGVVELLATIVAQSSASS
jgi:trehalose 6-phosphate phosphatase